MTAQRTTIGFWLLIGLIVAFAGAKPVLFDTMDPDCFWHLRVAQELQARGIGPLVDDLSFASQKEPWTPYSWLAELGMKGVWDIGGYRAAVAVTALMAAAFVGLLALCCVTVAPSRRLACVAATVVGTFLSLPYLSFRPVTAALVLLGLCAYLLLRDLARGEGTRAVWAVVGITAVLANVHLYVVIVPLWIAAMWIGAWWEGRDGDRRESAPQAGRLNLRLGTQGRYGMLLLLVCAACTATPMFAGSVRAALHYAGDDPMVRSAAIAEMQPLTHGAGALVVAAATLLAAWRLRRLRVSHRIWLVLGIVLVVHLGRFAPVYALIAAPVLALTLPELSDRVLDNRWLAAGAAAVLAIIVGRVIWEFPRRNVGISAWMNRLAPPAPGYPTGAADFVAGSVVPQTGRIINEFTWGGYLAWRLGDHWQVMMDGRTQLYSPEYWQTTCLGPPGPRRQFLASIRADAAVLPVERSAFRDTLLQLGWTSVYHDERAEVLAPPATPVAAVQE